jgi:hypothetical protein
MNLIKNLHLATPPASYLFGSNMRAGGPLSSSTIETRLSSASLGLTTEEWLSSVIRWDKHIFVIDAFGGRGKYGGTSCTPLKDFEKLDH